MKHWVETYNYQPIYDEFDFFSEDTIGYDIETTGLSSKRHQIYLIGCCTRRGNEITLHQFFAETPGDESEIIIDFFELAKDYKYQITFNGSRFDESFLLERAQKFDIKDDNFPKYHFDIFKECNKLKKLLGLASCSQKSIESFLGIQRIDTYSGGELIPVYKSYIQHPSLEQLRILKQHNYDDVRGMLSLLPILTYNHIFDTEYQKISIEKNVYKDYQGISQAEIKISGKLSQIFPSSFRLNSPLGYFIFDRDSFQGMIPLHHNTLRYYLSDYKDYVYLLNENIILLKELADYIPKDQKRKATPEECFIAKEDDYIKLPHNYPVEKNVHLFKESRKDKEIYISLNEINFWGNTESAQNFIKTFLQTMLSGYKKNTDK